MLASLGLALLTLGATLVEAEPQGVAIATTPGVAPVAATTPGVVDPAAATPGVAATPATSAAGSIPSNIVGTWSSKSNQTFTGPGFYDPRKEQMIEPSHTGISYSFTAHGFYETAYYRAIANPVNPACPGGIMQWQHGTFQVLGNGSMITAPIAVDGRQLLSQPCDYDSAIYSRYNQSELFKTFQWEIDPYHNIPRLNLFRFDGSPVMPLYLVFNPPQMLPTTTLKPTSTASGAQATSTNSSKFRLKRSLDEWGSSFSKPVIRTKQSTWINPNAIWWFGVGATGLGSVMYFCF